jgi:hypothetical protein
MAKQTFPHLIDRQIKRRMTSASTTTALQRAGSAVSSQNIASASAASMSAASAINTPSGFNYSTLTAYSPNIVLRLYWDPNPEPEAIGYKFYIDTNSDFSEASVSDVGETYFDTPPLEVGKTYYFGVAAYLVSGELSGVTTTWGGTGEGTPAATASFAAGVTAPGADTVAGLTATASKGRILAAWTAKDVAALAGYELVLYDNSDVELKRVRIDATQAAQNTEYTFIGLSAATYKVKIRWFDKNGNFSNLSASATDTVTESLDDLVYAENVFYDNTDSDLAAENVQDAIDELDATIDGLDLGLVGTKEVDETNIADGKILEYDTTSGKMVYVDKPTGGSGHYILITDEKAAGTHGGTFTSGAWQTRTLNTEKNDTGNHASISNNQITLAAGTYEVEISCPAKAVLAHQARLFNITDSATTLVGTTECTDLGGKENYSKVPEQAATTRSIIRGRFTLASAKVFEVQHRCASTQGTYGFGMAANFDEVEVYTIAQFHKVS